MVEENQEPMKDVASETESTSTPSPEPKSSSVATPPPKKTKPPHGGDKNVGLEVVVAEKRMALIKAWEENEKTKADNRAYTKKSEIGAWENTKKAMIEANLKQIEENIEIEKAKKREEMKNRMAGVHKEAEEKRAMVEEKRGQDIIKAEEAAAKFRATGTLPTKLFKCFGY